VLAELFGVFLHALIVRVTLGRLWMMTQNVAMRIGPYFF